MGTSADATPDLTAALDIARRTYCPREGEEPSSEERRQTKRLSFEHDVRLYIIGPSGRVQCSFAAHASDLGQDGMAVECSHLVHEDTRAWVEFEHPDGTTMRFFATVRYCVHESMTRHRVGLAFQQAPADVESLAA
ncbi:MAG: PilZ domain-containing protein [Phycisphaerales bacterium JB038]